MKVAQRAREAQRHARRASMVVWRRHCERATSEFTRGPADVPPNEAQRKARLPVISGEGRASGRRAGEMVSALSKQFSLAAAEFVPPP